MAFEGAEAGVVVQAPDFNGFIAAAGEDHAPVCSSGASGAAAGESGGVFGCEGDGPDATFVTAEDALRFAFFGGPDLDVAVLAGGGEEVGGW